MEHSIIRCSRDEFEQALGFRPSPDVIGVCFTDNSGSHILREYVFTDEPSDEDYALAHTSSQIAELERLYKL